MEYRFEVRAEHEHEDTLRTNIFDEDLRLDTLTNKDRVADVVFFLDALILVLHEAVLDALVLHELVFDARDVRWLGPWFQTWMLEAAIVAVDLERPGISA